MRRALLLLAALAAGCSSPKARALPDGGQCDVKELFASVSHIAEAHRTCATRDDCASIDPAPGTCFEFCGTWVRRDEAEAFQQQAKAEVADFCASCNVGVSVDCAETVAACLDDVCRGLLPSTCAGALDGGLTGTFNQCAVAVGTAAPSGSVEVVLIPVRPAGGSLSELGDATFELVSGGPGTYPLSGMSRARASATRSDGVHFDLYQSEVGMQGDAALTLGADGHGTLQATLVARYPDAGEESAALGVTF